MSGLPPSALSALELAARSLADKPISAAQFSKLDPLSVRRAMASARKKAKPGQVPGGLYIPKSGEPLLVMSANDLSGLIGDEEEEKKA